MAYMTVLKKTESQLSLLREPTFLSKAVFIGFLVGVSGVLLFGSESIFFKILIGLSAIVLSCFLVDNYEICDLNKETCEVRLTRLHFCQYFLGNAFSSHPYVTSKLSDIKDVRVEEQGGNESGKAYRVILSLNSGIQLGITEVFTTNEVSEHEKTAETLASFLGLDVKKDILKEDTPTSFLGINLKTDAVEDSHYEGEGPSSEIDDSDEDEEEDDDFEEITKEDIEKIEMEQETDTQSLDSTRPRPLEGVHCSGEGQQDATH